MKYSAIFLLGIFSAGILFTAPAVSGPVRNASVETDGGKAVEPSKPKVGLPDRQISAKIRDAWEIQKKMAEIEKNAIEQDQELKQMAVQIQTLHKQLVEKLQGKLQNNQEYQNLKVKRAQMRNDLMKLNVRFKAAPKP